ncbi:MAG: leucine-rich repeat domain-containing protein, partial [Patescibacteria group bacterium]|nr:leucine-rich repeat domain-containing protein [Patescibacteria group bacterium]
MLFASVLLSSYSVARNKAQRERVAATEVQKLGATLDTWVGWQEVVLGTDYAQVVRVDLRGVRDIRAAMRHLDALRHIEDLNLSGTSIVDGDLEHLKTLPNLTSLDLSDTRVTDAALDHLEGLENLRWLTLDKTDITDAGIEKLRRRL